MRALSINALAELTGIMPGTLRAWEARYRTLKPKRDRSNNRRFYSYDDVEKIRAIKQLLDQGLNIGRIARLEKSELLGLLQDLKPAEPPPVLAADNTESLEAIGECIQLLEGYKLKELHHRITRLRLNLSLEQFVNEFVVPFFYRIGLLYEVNKISVAQEHAFSAILKNHLLGILNSIPEVSGWEAAVAIATPEGNHHEFGIMIANIICRHRGLNTYYFGANLPAEALIDAINALQIESLILGNTPIPEEFLAYNIANYLAKLEKNITRNLVVFLGGGTSIKATFKHIDLIHCPNFQVLVNELTSKGCS